MKKILSIDGGGIRGIIPAIILDEVEKQMKKPIAELFDMVAGTSTGGLIALALLRPDPKNPDKPKHTAGSIVNIYKDRGREIFERSLWKKIVNPGAILDEKYPSQGLENVLNDYLKNSRADEALTEFFITTYEIERRKPFFFTRHDAKTHPRQYNFFMRDIARATSAAPTFFEPKKIMKPMGYAMIDGGVFANNPAMCALVEAKKIFPGETDFLVVSLGTGKMTRAILFEEAKDWGLPQWIVPLLSVMFDGVSSTVDYQMKKILPSTDYFRFDVDLRDMGNDDIDDASGNNINALKKLACYCIEENVKNGTFARLYELL